MSGPEHYRRAEELVKAAGTTDQINDATRTGLVAHAQVHATLALVAATVADEGDGLAWLRVTR